MFPKLFTISAFEAGGSSFGPFSLHTYGVLLVAALLAGLWLAGVLARRAGIDSQRVSDLGVSVIIGGLVGAKLLLIIVDYEQYRTSPKSILEVLQSGGVFYGGLLGALPVAWYFIRKYELPLLTTFDVLAPAVALGQAIGRLGCFAAGCCYGKVCTMPWAVVFHSEDARALVGVPIGVPLHPSQLYESLLTAALTVYLVRLFGARRFEGQVALAYLAFYAVIRFVLEFWRGDAARGLLFDGALSTSQLIALFVATATLMIWPSLSRRAEKAATS